MALVNIGTWQDADTMKMFTSSLHVSTSGTGDFFNFGKRKKKEPKAGSPRAILVALRAKTRKDLRPTIKRIREYII